MEQKEAVERAVKESIEENILKEILLQHRSEVVAMSIFEYDEEKELKLIRTDEREQGIEQGIKQGIEQGKKRLLLEMLSEIGDIPPVLKERVMNENDMELVKEWVKVVTKSNTMEEFITISGCLAT